MCIYIAVQIYCMKLHFRYMDYTCIYCACIIMYIITFVLPYIITAVKCLISTESYTQSCTFAMSETVSCTLHVYPPLICINEWNTELLFLKIYTCICKPVHCMPAYIHMYIMIIQLLQLYSA